MLESLGSVFKQGMYDINKRSIDSTSTMEELWIQWNTVVVPVPVPVHVSSSVYIPDHILERVARSKAKGISRQLSLSKSM